MMSKWLAGAAFALAIVGANAQTAPMASASGASTMAAPASGGKMGKRPARARVTGGPGYVSESGSPAASAGSMTPTPKPRATVTGGPGGTAGTPSTK